ncbi:MAG TPA: Hsp70 family protein [Streptosporangiaceae bacterium]|nr:Hsp70 family protein [Streptosporangiaceae bacterium]
MDARATLQQSIGIETRGGGFTPLINRGSTLPTSASFIFSTAEDNQPSVKVKVFRGEQALASGNAQVGRFEITGFTPTIAGLPQIQITFHVDEYQELTVSAIDLAGQRELSVARID